MRKTELMKALMALSGNPVIVVTSEGIEKQMPRGMLREGSPDPQIALLNGFSKSELLAENLGVKILDNDLVVLYTIPA